MKELKINNWRIVGMGPEKGVFIFVDPRYEEIRLFAKDVDRPAKVFYSGEVDSVSALQGQGASCTQDELDGPAESPQPGLPF